MEERRNKDAAEPAARRVSFSLRAKIIVTFFIISCLVSASLAFSTYRLLRKNLFEELRSRVRNLSELGGYSVDASAVKRLVGKMPSAQSEEAVSAVERSRDFREVSDQLNRIRDTESRLVRYVYLFVPAGDENMARYVVDADVLEATGGAEGEEEEVSHFNGEFDVSGFQIAREAMRDKKAMVEEEYSYDEVFKVNSVSGYAPIFDDGGNFVAMLGIDMVDSDVKEVLTRATRLSLVITVAAAILALATSVVFGSVFTKGIVSLDRVVRRFSESDFAARAEVSSSDEVGRLGSSFNRMAETIQRYSAELESLLKSYGRFVPHDFLRFLEKKSIVEVKLGDQVEREMTILFSDIRDFTTLSESMTPEQNFNFLNSYLSRMGPEIRAHGGFIDKYLGDGFMALFPGSADDAVAAAVSMRRKLAEYNAHRKRSGYATIRVGYGIHSGKLNLGTIGEEERMDGSVIADAVNHASRLEAHTRLFGGTILVSGTTLKALGDRDRFHFRHIARVQVRGRQEVTKVYEVFDGDPDEQYELKLKRKPAFLAALVHYYERRIEEAQKVFAALLKENPSDGVYMYYVTQCEKLITSGVPAAWNGVVKIQAK